MYQKLTEPASKQAVLLCNRRGYEGATRQARPVVTHQLPEQLYQCPLRQLFTKRKQGVIRLQQLPTKREVSIQKRIDTI